MFYAHPSNRFTVYHSYILFPHILEIAFLNAYCKRRDNMVKICRSCCKVSFFSPISFKVWLCLQIFVKPPSTEFYETLSIKIESFRADENSWGWTEIARFKVAFCHSWQALRSPRNICEYIVVNIRHFRTWKANYAIKAPASHFHASFTSLLLIVRNMKLKTFFCLSWYTRRTTFCWSL